MGLGQSVYLEHPAGYVSRLSLSKHPCIYTPCRDCLASRQEAFVRHGWKLLISLHAVPQGDDTGGSEKIGQGGYLHAGFGLSWQFE